MPYVGLGTGGLHHEEVKGVVKEAIRAGYRLIDTAREYGNENFYAPRRSKKCPSLDADHGTL